MMKQYQHHALIKILLRLSNFRVDPNTMGRTELITLITHWGRKQSLANRLINKNKTQNVPEPGIFSGKDFCNESIFDTSFS
jgi:hypothetical protein